jgi:cell division topological specificity factor
MNILNLFRRANSAPVARERLQILLSHERVGGSHPDLLAILREEILSTIARHVAVDRDNIRVRIDRGATISKLEIDVEIPHSPTQRLPRSEAMLATEQSKLVANLQRG